MAHNTEYRFQWKNIAGTTHQVDIELDSYGGSVNTIQNALQEPVKINRRATKTDGELVVVGSELQFNFIVAPADIAAWDAVMESEYKDYRVSYYVNSALKWRGWLQPANHKRDYVDNGANYKIVLSATDAIADLKDIEYNNFSTGDPFTDRQSIMTIIKRALQHTELELNFKVQLNTWEKDLMTSTDCALDKMSATSRRFEKTKDGFTTQEDCNTVLSEVLKPFNVVFMQSDGVWWIVNYQEPNSYYYPITYSSLAVGTRTASDIRVDLDGVKFERRGSLERLRPLRRIDTTFKDRNLGDELVQNGDFSSALTNWNKEDIISWSAGSGYLQLIHNTGLDPSVAGFAYTDAMAVTKSTGDNDKLRLQFKARLESVTPDSEDYEPVIIAQLFRGTYNGTQVVADTGSAIHRLYRGQDGYTTFEEVFPLDFDDDYFVRFFIQPVNTPVSDYTFCEVHIDDVSLVPEYSDATELTTDRLFQGYNSDNSYLDTDERVLQFGDSQADNDLGAYKDVATSTRSSSWNRYGKTDEISLQKIYNTNIIESFQEYKDYIRVRIVDANDEIEPHNALTINSIDYKIIGYSVVYKSGGHKTIDVELEEIKTAAVTVAHLVTQLTSVDGQSTSSSSAQTTSPTGASWGSITGSIASQTDLTLENVTGIGNETTNGIVHSDGTNKYTISVDGNGDLKVEQTAGSGDGIYLDAHVGVGKSPTASYALDMYGTFKLRKASDTSGLRGFEFTPGYHNEHQVIKTYGSSGALSLESFYTATGDQRSWYRLYPSGIQIFGTSTSGSAIERMRLTADGNLLIGQTTGNYLLDVDGDINVTSGQIYRVDGDQIAFNDLANSVVSDTPTQWHHIVFNGTNWGSQPPYIWHNEDVADFSTTPPNNGDVLTYNSVSGDWEAVAPSTGVSTLAALTDTTIAGQAAADFLRWTGATWANYPIASVRGDINYWTGTDATPTNVYRTGMVGIGGTPSYPLHIQMAAQASTNETLLRAEISDATGFFDIKNNTSIDGRFLPTFLGYQNDLASAAALSFIGAVDSSTDSSANAPVLEFQARETTDAGATGSALEARDILRIRNYGTELLRIDNAGNLLVGKTTGSYPVDVNGIVNASAFYVTSAFGNSHLPYTDGTIYLSMYTGKNLYIRSYNGSSHSNVAKFSSGGALSVATTTLTSGYAMEVNGKVRATDYTATSDKRLKSNIKPLEDALDTIAKMSPVTFSWKGRTEKKLGFIAQDILTIPELRDSVVKGADQYYSLNNNDYIGLAIAGLQETQGLIKQLRKEITGLKRRMTTIERKGEE